MNWELIEDRLSAIKENYRKNQDGILAKPSPGIRRNWAGIKFLNKEEFESNLPNSIYKEVIVVKEPQFFAWLFHQIVAVLREHTNALSMKEELFQSLASVAATTESKELPNETRIDIVLAELITILLQWEAGTANQPRGQA